MLLNISNICVLTQYNASDILSNFCVLFAWPPDSYEWVDVMNAPMMNLCTGYANEYVRLSVGL